MLSIVMVAVGLYIRLGILETPAFRRLVAENRIERALVAEVIVGAVATGIFGFIYFAMLNTTVPALIFLGVVLSFVPHDLMYGPQAALIAECFTPRVRYSDASIGYQLSSVISGGPAPLIATALLAASDRAM
jgi:hypothetical protein